MTTTIHWHYSLVLYGFGPMLTWSSGSHMTLLPWSWDPSSVWFQCSSTQLECLSETWRSSRTLRLLFRYSRVSCQIKRSLSLSPTPHRFSRWQVAPVSRGCSSRWLPKRRWSSTTIQSSIKCQSLSQSSYWSTVSWLKTVSRLATLYSRPTVTATHSSSSWSSWSITELCYFNE